LATDYIQKRRGEPGLFSFEYSLLPKLILYFTTTLESGIDVGHGINVGPGKLGKKNKRRALNTHLLCSE
jgi:hypothetical protein